MNLEKAVSVRFDRETRLRLERISEVSRLTIAHLIRHATLEFLDRAEERGKINIQTHLRENSPAYRTR